MGAPAFKLVGEYELSVKQYPNIKVGEDFKGYAIRLEDGRRARSGKIG
jgi:hypothetical protein